MRHSPDARAATADPGAGTALIDAKLHPPSSFGLSRARLLDRVVGAQAPAVVVVTAAAGAGKTTVLARAAASASRAAWCSVGPEDRGEATFLAHVTEALARAAGAHLGRPAAVDALVASLECSPNHPITMFLDDVHELDGSASEQHLADLLRWRPAGLRMVVASRRSLPLNTPRLLLSGELCVLDDDALRFRSWEVEELFRGVYREPLSPECAAALSRRTGGWAAGLALFHLATTGKSPADRERSVARLSGRSRLLRSYLTRTVLDELDGERRRFLLLTSTLGTLTGPLCDALLGRTGSASVLEELTARHFFVVPAEDGGSYRYHQVLRTLLENMLTDELGGAAARDVYRRGAALLESGGLLSDAVRAYALAEDVAAIARLVQHHDAGLLADHLDYLESSVDDPWLTLARARRLHRQGALSAAMAAFDRAEALLDDDDLRRRCRAGQAKVAAWLPGGPPGPRRPPSPHPRAPLATAQVVRRALSSAPARPWGDDEQSSALGRGLAELLGGNLPGAREHLSSPRITERAERLAADMALVACSLLAGSAEGTMSRLEEVVLGADLADEPWLARLGRGFQAAVLLVERDEAWRSSTCAALVEECRAGGDFWGEALLSGVLGAALGLGGEPTASHWLDRADRVSEELGAPVLQAWAQAAVASCSRRDRLPDAVVRAQAARATARGCEMADLSVADLAAHRAPRAFPSPPDVTHDPGPRIRCLGGFVIESDDGLLELCDLRPLPRTLLLVLALHHAHDLHREVLIDMLWPDTSLEAASHRLHAAASSVRRGLARAGLEGSALRRSGESYGFHLSGATHDVLDLESHVRRGREAEVAGDHELALGEFRQAIESYGGDLLPEAGPADWVVEERDRLRVLTGDAARSAALIAAHHGTPDEALPLALRATSLDPLRDSTWRLLADIQTEMGDHTAASVTRREHAEVSAREVADGPLSPRGAPRPGARRGRA